MLISIQAMEFAGPPCGETAFWLMTPTEPWNLGTVASYVADNCKNRIKPHVFLHFIRPLAPRARLPYPRAVTGALRSAVAWPRGHEHDVAMNDNHQRHLLVTFHYIDDLLSEAEHILVDANSPSPFRQFAADSNPTQRKVIHDYCVRVREAMARILNDLQIPPKPPVCGSLWAARNQLTFASIAVAEIEPKRMRGYGEMTAEDTAALGRVVAELNTLLDHLSAFLDQGPAADLQSCFERLEETTDEVRLLRELARIVTTHGLVEFRGTLNLLLDRLEHPVFEIGVFGRVSSGKSSLLNHLLGAEVLPVGVTPVTAIPTRIRFGPEPLVIVDFADRQKVVVEPGRLVEFASEQGNPANAKHVSRIHVELPSPCLKDGVTFVDTPGLGSLATAGAEETLAYLPRCDLGLVLIDAGSTLTHEDLKLVQALYHSGAAAMVLVSKADLLQPADRSRTAAYVRQQLAAELSLDLPVYLVSVVGPDVALSDHWLETELRPKLVAHRDLAAASLKRKAGALREWVIRALDARLGQSPTLSPQITAEQLAALQQRLREADRLFETARREAEDGLYRSGDWVEPVLQAAALDLAAAWRGVGAATMQVSQVVADAVLRVVSESSTALLRPLEELRVELAGVLRQASEVFPLEREPRGDLPKPANLPPFDPAALTNGLCVRRPRVVPLLGQTLLQRSVRETLREALVQPLQDQLGQHRSRLRSWLHQYLTELQAAYGARAEIYRAQFERRVGDFSQGSTSADLEGDLRWLRDWIS